MKRRITTVRIFDLGQEPGGLENLSGTTTPEERLRILAHLSDRAWKLTGNEVPSYRRDEIPVHVVRLR